MLSLKGWKGCLNWVNWGNFSSLMYHQGFTSVLFWLDQVFDLHRNHLESSFPWSSGIFPASYSSVLSALHFFPQWNRTINKLQLQYKAQVSAAAILSLELDWGSYSNTVQLSESRPFGMHLYFEILFFFMFSFIFLLSFFSLTVSCRSFICWFIITCDLP